MKPSFFHVQRQWVELEAACLNHSRVHRGCPLRHLPNYIDSGLAIAPPGCPQPSGISELFDPRLTIFNGGASIGDAIAN